MSATIDYLPPERVKYHARRSDLWGAWLTFHVWAVIIGAGATFVIWPSVWTFLIAFTIIGSRQHGMSVLMHDAAHGVLFKTKWLNEWVGEYLLAAPYGGDLKTYRKYHLKHHRFAQSKDDPDLPLAAKYPLSKASMTRKLLRDISGLTFLRLRLSDIRAKSGTGERIKGSEAFEKNSHMPTLIANGLMFGSLALMGLWWVYPLLWALPLMTWLLFIIRIRNIAEHALTTYDDNPLTHARTTRANWLARIFLAPYWVNYHVEHHAYMFVPCYRLKGLHHDMKRAGHVQNMEYKPNYLSVLKLAVH